MNKYTYKRIIDILMVVPGLILMLPVMGFIVLLIRLKLGSPVLFCQLRPGLHGRSFINYKFRTMSNEQDSLGNILQDAKRLTLLGQFLRSSSLDELPELFNILKGDMSFVGPRPLLIRYLERYTPEQARRQEVKPGLTGWAQVNGRNAISWEQKFELDVWYVDNCSVWLDVKILFLTVLKVIKREGISHAGHVNMEEFMGSELFHTDSIDKIDENP